MAPVWWSNPGGTCGTTALLLLRGAIENFLHGVGPDWPADFFEDMLKADVRCVRQNRRLQK